MPVCFDVCQEKPSKIIMLDSALSHDTARVYRNNDGFSTVA